MGEDAIFMWKFLSSNGTPPESPKKSNQMVVIGRKEERDSPKKSLRKGELKLCFLFATLLVLTGDFE